MREIKFRVWDGKKMWGVFSLGELFDVAYDLVGDPDPRMMAGEAVMQYTGLKDRHGREIYEGDVVRSPCGVDLEVVWAEEFKVEYGHGDSIYRVSTGFLLSSRVEGLFEVVGNIHENPELVS